MKTQNKKNVGLLSLVVALLLALTAVGAGAVAQNLALGAGDTSHVTCAGPSLSVSGQSGTALDLTCAPSQVGQTVGFAASGVTYVYSGSATTNFNGANPVNASASTYKSLLQFQTTPPSGLSVTNAVLTLTPAATTSGGFQVLSAGTFNPATVTWNNKPAIGTTVLGSSGSTVAGTAVNIPLTGVGTLNETDLALSYSPSGVIGKVSTSGVVLTLTYGSGGPPTTTTTTTMPTTTTTTQPVTNTGHKTIVIMEENHSSAQAFAQMPYLQSLATNYGQASNYAAITHPSLPNYLAIFGGTTYGTSSDCSVGCGPTGAGDRSVWDQAIAGGFTAKAYQESMPSNCDPSGSGAYAPRHGPWPYWTNPTSRSNCNKFDVPLTGLQADITSGNLPNIGEITPNLNDDWHDGSAAQADAFLQSWVPKLVAGTDFVHGNLTIIITFDENDGSSGNIVPFVVVDPNTQGTGVVVSNAANHYSLTRWLEDSLGLPRLGNAASASDLRGGFGIGTP